jgi:hypothetical protein
LIVKRRHADPANPLAPQTGPDARSIDQLYGLEPVFEPDAGPAGGTEAVQFVTVRCPYCDEEFQTSVDLSGGSFSYVEDCQVCCQPIELGATVDDEGQLVAVTAQRLD